MFTEAIQVQSEAAVPKPSPSHAAEQLLALYSDGYEQLRRVVERMAGNDVAEDAMQNAIIRCFYNIRQYDPTKGTIKSWYLRAARNAAIDIRRHSSLAKNSLPFDELLDYAMPTTEGPESDVGAIDIESSLSRLSPSQEAVLRAKIDGYTHSEIARNMDVPLGTANTRCRLGQDRLQATLNPTSTENNVPQ